MNAVKHTIVLDPFDSIQEVEAAIPAAVAVGDQNAELELRQLAVEAHLEDGEPGRAVHHCHRLIDAWTEREGPDGEHAMVSRGFLGRALTEACLYGEAEGVLGQLVVDRERVLGADDPMTFVTRGNLARAIGRCGRPEEAIVIAEQLLADRLRVLGPDHPSTLDTRGHLAQFHADAGRSDLAVDMLLDLLADRHRILDPDDPVLASTQHNLATISAGDDVPLEAVEGLRQNVVAQTERFGPDHPGTLIARGVVAKFLSRRGRYDEALPLYESLLSDRARVLGELSPATLGTHAEVAVCLRGLDRVDESIIRLRAICRAATATHGPREITTLAIRAELVASLMVKGDEESVSTELDALYDEASDLEPDVPLRQWIEEAFETWFDVEWLSADDEDDVD